MADWTRLDFYPSAVAAEIARARLEQAGIEARVETDDVGGAYPVLQGRGTRLLVDPEELDRARLLLAETASQDEAMLPESEETLAESEIAVRDRDLDGSGGMAFSLLPLIVFTIVAFLLGVQSARHGFLAYGPFRTITSTLEVADLNKDGRDDTWYRYSGVNVVRSEHDRNFDGKVDQWVWYLDSLVNRVELDNDFDGRVDTWEDYSPIGLHDVAWDADGDGVVDATTEYEDSVASITRYAPGEGPTVREDRYVDGLLREVKFFGPDGEVERIDSFDAMGRPAEHAASVDAP